MNALLSDPASDLSTVVSPCVASANPLLDWIDRELGESVKLRQVRGANLLLDLRQTFARPLNHLSIRRFFLQLAQLAKTHFLLAFRIRQWISLNFQVEISDPLARSPAMTFPLPASLGDLRTLRRQFFENSPTLVPWNEVRITFIAKAPRPTHGLC